jgi:hypothetical protein
MDNAEYMRGLHDAASTNCMYCNGTAVGYIRTPHGPNSAGNYVHAMDRGEDSVLCRSSSIYSLIAWQKTGLKAFKTEVTC